MEEKKSNKGLIGLVVVLIIMVLGLGGYIVYDKVLSTENETKKNNVEENEVEKSELSFDEAKKQIEKKMEYIMKMDDDFDSPDFEIYYSKDKVNVSDLSNIDRLFLAFKSIEPTEIPEYDEKHLTIKDNEIDTAMKNLFGENVKYNHESVCSKYTGICRKYDLAKKEYDIYSQAIGSRGFKAKYKIINYTQDKNKIFVYIKSAVIAPNLAEPLANMTIYNFPWHQTDNIIDSIRVDDIYDYDQIKFDNYLDKIKTYKLTFINENNNYIFESIENEK